LNGEEGINTTSIVAFSVGILIAVVGVIYVSCLVKRQLNAEAEKQKQNNSEAHSGVEIGHLRNSLSDRD